MATTNPLLNPRNYARITGIALAVVAVLGIILSAVGKEGEFGFICPESKFTCDGTLTTDTTDDAETTNAQASFLGFDWTHNILHVVLAAVALLVGYGTFAPSITKYYAIAFGAVYTVLGVVGFMMPALAMIHLELGENLIHLVIGVWGLAAGFLGAVTTTSTTTTTTTPMVAGKR